jgi:rubrerythrin
MRLSSSDKVEQQIKKIYDDILLFKNSTDKKKGVRALASYGKKAIPFLQELRSIETNEDVKNYMFDAITQIEKVDILKESLK